MLEIFIHFQVQKTSNNSSIDLTIKNIGLVHIYSESSDTISFFSFSRPFVLSFYFGYHLPLAHPRYPFPLHRPPLSTSICIIYFTRWIRSGVSRHSTIFGVARSIDLTALLTGKPIPNPPLVVGVR